MSNEMTEHLHATAVAVDGRGLVILGASGSGKSTLALEMIARGATLVADDLVRLSSTYDGALLMASPEAGRGQIEARGFGILALPSSPARAVAAVSLDQVETDRLPKAHETVIAGVTLPLFYKVESPAFPAILLAYLRGERVAP